MLRICGIALIFTGSLGLGFFYKTRYEKGIEVLKNLAEITELFISEIEYGKATLHDCLRVVSEKAGTPYKECFLKMADRIELENAEFTDVFREEAESLFMELPITKREAECFLGLIGFEGISDLSMQIRLMEQTRDKLFSMKKEKEAKREKQGKVALSLGAMGGLFLTIILL